MNENLPTPESDFVTGTSKTPEIKGEKPMTAKESFWDLAKFVVILLAIVIPFRMYVAQPFIVHGSSMYPTFNGGKDVIGNKTYGDGGFGDYLIIDELSYLLREPKRGEVIVFHNPNDTSVFFIKRIIGLPNETVSIKRGVTTIIKPDGKSEVLTEKDYLGSENLIEVTKKLGADEYYVLGDNRQVSFDSRSWGPLKKSFITGRAFLRLFPPTKISYLPGEHEFAN
ncbi:MAG: signal peptidase I [Candidatus Vogelbacteria bacterium]|nr:signal peptidase I [Candidatus Vogelbacteria bacterium]